MAAILRVKDENGNIVSIPAIKGDKGEKGDRGLPGSGGIPDGGTTGQVLTKNSNADGDAGWKDTEHDLFNANGKTYEEVIYAYESGKVCYLTYAGTKLLNNGYSGNRNPFKFSGENSNGEILTATLSYDNTLTFGDRGDYQITTASQTLSKEKQSQALANIGGLSKNQGTANSGKFLGIGADGIVIPTDSPTTAFSDDGSGNISVNGASSDAKRFLNSLTVPGLNYKYVNPINSGTYASPYGVYISSGTVIDYVVGLTQVGFYTAYVNRKVTDIPDAAKAANSSLRGFVCISQIDNTASGGSQKCYAYTVLIDQNSNFYIQYIQSSTGGGWKRMYPYETAESALMKKLDKNQGAANSGKFLGIGADGVVVPTEVGGGSSEWTELYQGTIEVSEPVSSLTVDFVKSCEGMTEAVMSFASTKGEGELTGNTSMHCKFGLFGVTYGRLGNYSAACDDKYYLLAPNKYQSMFYKNSKSANNIYFNTSQCLTGWVEPSVLNNPNYNQMIIDFWGSPGYQGKITLRIVGR